MIDRSEKSFAIGERRVGLGEPVFVIAEAGVNHDGSVAKAHALIDAAADAAADAVKFQTFIPDALVTRSAPAAEYQQETVGAKDQHSMLSDLTLPDLAWAELAAHAQDRNIAFLSTPFDPRSLALLLQVGVPAVKISSGDISNHVLLRAVAASGLPVIVSSGASTFEDVERALAVFDPSADIAVLHCVTAY
ncbi:MAG: N-acetylneuraminate synthase family protein, partial [Rhodococcus sp. (in: high G+C Gram-positive bacteria)]